MISVDDSRASGHGAPLCEYPAERPQIPVFSVRTGDRSGTKGPHSEPQSAFVSPSGPLHPGTGQVMSGSWVGDAVRGLGISALNPKGLLLFLALLPQFTDSNSPWPIPLQIVPLGLTHTASCAVVYTAVGTG